MNVRASLKGITISAISFVPSLVLAGSVPVPIEGNAVTLRDIVLLVQRVMNIGIILATLGVVAMIVYGGFQMATSAGNEANFTKGKTTLKYAIYGALVVFGVGLIVNTIANVAYDPSNVLY